MKVYEHENKQMKRCGKAYTEFTAYSYQIKASYNNEIIDINLQITPSDFLYLTSLEKLNGI